LSKTAEYTVSDQDDENDTVEVEVTLSEEKKTLAFALP